MKKLKFFVKYNKTIYYLYFFCGSVLLRIMGLFVKIHDNRILFVAYGGQRYDDSPKNIYEYMKKDSKFKTFELVWAFIEPDNIDDYYEKKSGLTRYHII